MHQDDTKTYLDSTTTRGYRHQRCTWPNLNNMTTKCHAAVSIGTHQQSSASFSSFDNTWTKRWVLQNNTSKIFFAKYALNRM